MSCGLLALSFSAFSPASSDSSSRLSVSFHKECRVSSSTASTTSGRVRRRIGHTALGLRGAVRSTTTSYDQLGVACLVNDLSGNDSGSPAQLTPNYRAFAFGDLHTISDCLSFTRASSSAIHRHLNVDLQPIRLTHHSSTPLHCQDTCCKHTSAENF